MSEPLAREFVARAFAVGVGGNSPEPDRQMRRSGMAPVARNAVESRHGRDDTRPRHAA